MSLANPITVGLANQFRPQVWEKIVGQEPIKRFFQRSLSADPPRLRSVYLLPGVHGCGKTTAAKILARWFNCDNRQGPNPCNKCRHCEASLRGQGLTLEVDGTSQNKADFVEENVFGFLRGEPPPGKYHVVIIDEFHRVKDPARSMFLPFLEFMDIHHPRSVVILCTTDLGSIDKPLLSRACIPGTFQGLSPSQVAETYAAKLDLTPEICSLVLRISGGSMRQFWNTYDALRETAETQTITVQDVLNWVGGVSDRERAALWTAVRQRDRKKIKEIWDFWMTSNRAGFDFVATQLLEDLDNMVLTYPDEDIYVEAHQKVAMALTYQTHPAAKLSQLMLGALYGLTLPAVANSRPKPQAPVDVLPATVTPAKEIQAPKPNHEIDPNIYAGLGDDDDDNKPDPPSETLETLTPKPTKNWDALGED